ncbi:hsf-1 [Pristionchus pacificus]|uniref:Hsf-1 n=1 Tax=Pristionchus pacificus TaxID=54126 RepID=A0A2A6BVA9_PRIPA|nr:hsf-1 [Pristionchus pacificus]|eukprot:PDM69797.1 hsf-1 [Pristionchus pacificus]
MAYSAPKQEQMSRQDDQVAIMGGESVQVTREDEKIPLFLIKLWNIVEDPSYQKIVHWDDSGYSFHIVDPYSFCRNVLPHYFKHNNLNSLIRQLNMYGFRKMTPLDRSGLTRAESDQDHLEFSHPYFVRDHPELLINIKRKSSNRNENNSSGQVSQNNLGAVSEELRTLRERQRHMDAKMANLVKENENMWEQISHMRAQHDTQRKVVEKLVQFLVALVGPGQKPRIPRKRGMLALDEAPLKRSRSSSSQYSSGQVNVLSDVLDNLQKQLNDGNLRRTEGPIIADITEELSPTLSNSPPPSTSFIRPPSQYADICGSSMINGDEMGEASTSSALLNDTWENDKTLNRTVTPTSPIFSINPSIDFQWGNDLQEYLNGVDQSIDSCRDILGRDNYQWDLDGSDLDVDRWITDDNGGQLALEGVDPLMEDGEELVTPNQSPPPM